MRLHARFESGNLAGWEPAGRGAVRFAARADGSPRPLWFYFRAEEIDTPEVHFSLTNADHCLGPRRGWRTARPVYRFLPADPASVAPANAGRAGDGWHRCADARYEERTGTFRFNLQLPPGSSPGGGLEVAYCYPYTVADGERYFRQSPAASRTRRRSLAASPEGRPIGVVTVGEATKTNAWIVARQHAGETPSSYALEGMLDWLGGEGEASARARAAASYHLAPLVDPDGVFHGRFGKDGAPIDFNRDWSSAPQHPAIAALAREAETLGRSAPPALLLDLHASHHGDTSCYLFADEDPSAGRLAAFLAGLEAESPPGVGFRRTDVRCDPPPLRSARAWWQEQFGALSLCVELSYHLAQTGQYMTPAHYRAFGGALARAAARYLSSPGAQRHHHPGR